MQDELTRYREFLENLAKNNDTTIFTNAGVDHAPILFSVLFDNTQNEIRMYARGLYPELTNNQTYLDAFCKYLDNPGKKLKLLVDTADNKEEQAFAYVIKKAHERGDDSIQYRVILPEDREHICEELKFPKCNIAIFDDRKFRLETNPEDFKAFGSFNNVDIASKLSKLFDRAFANATAIPA